MDIKRWFQGVAVCSGTRASGIIYEESALGEPMANCLWTQAQLDGLSRQATTRLAAVVERHFPARAWCEQCSVGSISRLIHFNNHPETTREDIDKVLRIYTEEMEK